MKTNVFLRDALEVLVARTEAEETRRLRADIGRLQRETAGLKEEVRTHRLQYTTGVPQGSVLGPVLWNVGYDWVLRSRLLPGMGIFCYADDTLVLSRRRNYKEAARLAEVGTDLVISRIERLGLRVRIDKTEALLFLGTGRKGSLPGATLFIGGGRVRVSPTMKYLDGGWTDIAADGFRSGFSE